MNELAIEVLGLVKYFGGRKVLDGIDLAVPGGCVYGLLGRNGSGKTTLIRMLLGLEPATRGEARVLGGESWDLPASVRGRIGYVAEGHPLLGGYRVGQLAELCRGLARRWDQGFFDGLIERFRLPRDRKVKELSTGMRAQLNLALALARDPELLILDDPTLGLDTVMRREFLELALELIGKEGRTILFSSHILGDVERMADRIGILVGGVLAVDCELDELKERVRKVRVIFDGEAPSELAMTGIIRQERRGRELVVTIANYDEAKRRVIEGYRPLECVEVGMSLEDIFIECTAPLRGERVESGEGHSVRNAVREELAAAHREDSG